MVACGAFTELWFISFGHGSFKWSIWFHHCEINLFRRKGRTFKKYGLVEGHAIANDRSQGGLYFPLYVKCTQWAQVSQFTIFRINTNDFCTHYSEMDTCCECPKFVNGDFCQWNCWMKEGRWETAELTEGSIVQKLSMLLSRFLHALSLCIHASPTP